MRRLVICMFRISRQTSRGLRDAHVVALLFRRLSPKEREREKKTNRRTSFAYRQQRQKKKQLTIVTVVLFWTGPRNLPFKRIGYY